MNHFSNILLSIVFHERNAYNNSAKIVLRLMKFCTQTYLENKALILTNFNVEDIDTVFQLHAIKNTFRSSRFYSYCCISHGSLHVRWKIIFQVPYCEVCSLVEYCNFSVSCHAMQGEMRVCKKDFSVVTNIKMSFLILQRMSRKNLLFIRRA